MTDRGMAERAEICMKEKRSGDRGRWGGGKKKRGKEGVWGVFLWKACVMFFGGL